VLLLFFPTPWPAGLASVFEQLKNYISMEQKNKKQPDRAERQGFPGYPHYPSSQDAFTSHKVDEEIDPEEPDKVKTSEQLAEDLNEKDFTDDVSGSDLDIPGAEDDDAQEAIGSEDEENNYYSLGGDNHESQEEQTGDKL
jgi:hypothetical protein